MSLSTFVLKITSFCNLNCSYCYVFNAGDFSYLKRPKVMPLPVARQTLSRIANYARLHGIKQVYVVLHGGEPMLAGQDWIREFAAMARAEDSEALTINLSMQTNGVGLDDSWLDLLADLRIPFGISLDGPEEVNDKARVNHAGHGSYRYVKETLDRIQVHPRAPEVFGGVLCVVNPAQDGLAIYRHFRQLGLKKIDFLMPHDYNWDRLPPYFGTGATPVADYLIPIFDDWWAENDPAIKIRMFEVLLSLIFGRQRILDSLGGFPLEEAVIEADGSIEPLDVLKECGDGFTQLGMNVTANTLDDFMDHPLVRVGLRGREGLCQTCKGCALGDICGGGYLPHRWGAGREFDNPSIHCQDLWKLIIHMIDCVSHVCLEQIESLEEELTAK